MNYQPVTVDELEVSDRQNKVNVLVVARALGQVISIDVLDNRFITVLQAVRFDYKGA